jgi:hypothetical protein
LGYEFSLSSGTIDWKQVSDRSHCDDISLEKGSHEICPLGSVEILFSDRCDVLMACMSLRTIFGVTKFLGNLINIVCFRVPQCLLAMPGFPYRQKIVIDGNQSHAIHGG